MSVECWGRVTDGTPFVTSLEVNIVAVLMINTGFCVMYTQTCAVAKGISTLEVLCAPVVRSGTCNALGPTLTRDER